LLVIQVRPSQERTELNLLSEFRGPAQTASVLSLKSVISGIRNLHLVRFGATCEASCH
jgi:hypothetical protein